MPDRTSHESSELLKVYYSILREMGPDPVLERRIEEQEEHLNEEQHAAAS